MAEIDYELEWIHASLSTGRPEDVTQWRDAFDQARHGWQLERARRLLRVIKAQALSRQAQSLLRYYEGLLLVDLGEWQRARAAYTAALDLKRQVGDRQGEAAVLNALANLLRRSDRPPAEALKLYQQALDLAAELDDEETKVSVLNGMGLAYYAQGQLDEAKGCFSQVQAFARDHGQPALEAASLHNLGSAAWTQGQSQEAENAFGAALDLQRSMGDTHGQAETLNSIGLVQEAYGDWSTAAVSYRNSLVMMQAAGDYYGQVQVLVNLANVVWLSTDYDSALSYYEQAVDIAQDLGDLKLEGQALTGLGDTYRALGRYDEAEAVLRQALERKGTAGDERSLKHTCMSLGAVYQNQSRLDEAEQAYEETLSHATAHGDTRIEAVTCYNMGLIALAQENLDLASTRLKDAERIALGGDYRDCLAWVYRAIGDLEMMRPAPESGRVLQCYVEACAYAADFNQVLLDDILDHLVTIWTAYAEDGRIEEALWFCDSAIALWQESGLAEGRHEVVEAFQTLKQQLRKSD